MNIRGIGFHITQRCNLKCQMCWWWGNDAIKPIPYELDTPEIMTILDKLPPVFISIGGGEPTIRGDFLEILQYAHQKGMECEVLTNGTLITSEIAKGLNDHASSVVFSIEGTQEVHDSIRGEGSFNKAIHGINLVRQTGKVETRINTTISSLNYEHLVEVVQLAHDLKCSLSFQYLVFSNPIMGKRHLECVKEKLGVEDNFGLSNGIHNVDTKILLEQLTASRIKADTFGVLCHINPSVRKDEDIIQWYSNLSPIQNMYCSFPLLWVFIRPDGEVIPCEFINYSYGNLLKESLPQIWSNEKARHFRDVLNQGLFPGCVRCCKLEPKLWR